jgi:HAD superfamily hydrolase (TIGR01509 family)
MYMRPFDVLLFDLGGVLIELTGSARLLEWTPHIKSIESLWQFWLTSPTVRSFETGRSTPEQFATTLIAEMSLEVSAEQFLTEFTGWPTRPYPGSQVLLKALSEYYRLGCLANTNELHWKRISEEMGLLDLFHVTLASHKIGVLKPDQEAFLYAAEKMRAAPERILFLDDNLLNVQAAQAVGMVAYRVQGLAESVAKLRELGIPC